MNNMPQTISQRVIWENVTEEVTELLKVKMLRKKFRIILGKSTSKKIIKVRNTSKPVFECLFKVMMMRSLSQT